MRGSDEKKEKEEKTRVHQSTEQRQRHGQAEDFVRLIV